MRHLFLCTAVFLSWAGAALAGQPLGVQGMALTNGRFFNGEGVTAGSVTMPWVRSDNQVVADRINAYLFIRQMDTLPPRSAAPAFTLADGVTTGIDSQTFAVTRNDGQVLAVTFESDACGAYCESGNTSYLFDAETGRSVTAANIFTDAGMRRLVERMGAERKSRYRKQLAALQADLETRQAKQPSDKDAMDDLPDRIELNKRCLDAVEDDAGFTGLRVEFDRKGLNLTHERCSNHAEHALDDVDEVTLSIPYTDDAFAPLLTGYGRHLLLNAGAGGPSDTIYGQVLRGRLGGHSAITMLLERNDTNGPVSGTYFYDKFRKPIDLFGKEAGGTLDLAESAPDGGDAKGKFRLAIDGARLKGQWSDGSKTFDIDLAP